MFNKQTQTIKFKQVHALVICSVSLLVISKIFSYDVNVAFPFEFPVVIHAMVNQIFRSRYYSTSWTDWKMIKVNFENILLRLGIAQHVNLVN